MDCAWHYLWTAPRDLWSPWCPPHIPHSPDPPHLKLGLIHSLYPYQPDCRPHPSLLYAQTLNLSPSVSWKQGDLEGGRNCFQHWKDMELLHTYYTESVDPWQVNIGKGRYGVLCVLLFIELCMTDLNGKLYSFSLLLILLGWKKFAAADSRCSALAHIRRASLDSVFFVDMYLLLCLFIFVWM